MLQPGLLYFAYGCNMDPDFLAGLLGAELAPGWPARLNDWRLSFNKGGEGEDGDEVTANLVESEGCRTLGVVYRLPREHLARLDEFEAVPEHYRREMLWVEPLGRRARQAALVYVAQPTWLVEERAPAESYLERLIRGAAMHRLPPPYREWLQALGYGEAGDCYRGGDREGD
jgi:cation transport regulator ChaC